jgi:hypothetical protein
VGEISANTASTNASKVAETMRATRARDETDSDMVILCSFICEVGASHAAGSGPNLHGPPAGHGSDQYGASPSIVVR